MVPNAIAYYLRHRNEVEAYLPARERQAEQVRRRIKHEHGEMIKQRAQQLREPVQEEIFNFIEFMSSRMMGVNSRQTDAQWSQFSLIQAIRGLEDEDAPVSDLPDLKETWQ